MKNKKILIKFMLLVAICMSIPAVSSAPAFTSFASEVIASGGSDGPSDNGGQKPVEAPKSGSTLDKIVDSVKSVLSGLLSGYDTPDTTHMG